MDYVIDTNFLRKPELQTALQTAGPADRFILADAALIETLKNAQWELTAQYSFDIITPHAEKLYIAKAPSDLFREEIATGTDVRDTIDPILTRSFRALLAERATATDGPATTYLKTNISSAQSDLSRQQQNHSEMLKDLHLVTDDIRKSLNIPKYRNLTPDKQESARLFLIKYWAKARLIEALKLEHKPAELGKLLANGRGCLIRYQIGCYCLGFKWALSNGLGGGLAPKKATNEWMDLDHALTATYFDDILTEEASVNQLRADILQILNSDVQFDLTEVNPV